MVGALIGDLAAWSWENDRDVFFSRLIDMNCEPSSYGMAMMKAASRNILSGQSTPVEPIERPGNISYSGEWLMWQIVSAWIDTHELIDLPHFYSLDKAEGYARYFMIELIKELRKGSTKSQAFHNVHAFSNLIQNKFGNWKANLVPGLNDGILVYVFRAWDSFYRGFDFTSSIHNAMKWPGDKHLLGALTGAFADAMYGCHYNLIKKKYSNGANHIGDLQFLTLGEKYGFHHGLIMEMCNYSKFQRSFYPKNEALTNVEYHHWIPSKNLFEEIRFSDDEHKSIMKSGISFWDQRYGFYLDDGWHYIYQSGNLIARFKLDYDGSYWRITNWYLSGERSYKDSIKAFEWVLYDGCKKRNQRITDLMSYLSECKYFNGEENVPSEWAKTIEGKFWHGEMMFLTSQSDFKKWESLSASTLNNLQGSQKKNFEKYSERQRTIVCYIETLYRKWCPCENMSWITQY